MFEFSLAQPEQIEPWGDPPNNLHWFGISLGSYHIDLKTERLLEYCEGGYVEYQVARFHDDLLEILPDVLEPLPECILERLVAGSMIATRSSLIRAIEKLDGDHPAHDAVAGMSLRSLDTNYLRPRAEIMLWRSADAVVIEWDNRGLLFEGRPAWSATCGQREISVDALLSEIEAFHTRFTSEMAARVELAIRGWPRPGVEIDIPNLQANQHWREDLFRITLLQRPREVNWEALRPLLN